MITVGVCMGCGGMRLRESVDVSTISDPEPIYIPGRWEACCGGPVATRTKWYAPPVRMVKAAPMLAVALSGTEPIGIAAVEVLVCHVGPPAPYPKVPTPEDLLRGAGLYVGLP